MKDHLQAMLDLQHPIVDFLNQQLAQADPRKFKSKLLEEYYVLCQTMII